MPLSLHALFRDAKRTSAGSTIISGKSSVKIVIYDDFLELYGIFLIAFLSTLEFATLLKIGR
ncbi:hypothetical protein [Croceitalea vernalis]|uniref:Uncharacterized protein n=1 Tax=Croceitalea vernalis TaxID=3075599 RepID=A0ABU3BER6_9FLAO|nr:hypothetical protein [Croceitalea sp. P007]MDT0620657.1 hypothetical protein [Croceitalea sp. P007]